jgi:hypothetical protein
MKHPLQKTSFKVTILNPQDDTPKHKLYYFWNVSPNEAKQLEQGKLSDGLKKYVGGIDLSKKEEEEEEEFNFDKIDEAALQITEDKVDVKQLKDVNYFTTSIYPEDSFWTLKQKIFLSTGIPIYRQHLFVRLGEIHKTAYSVVIQDSDYPISRKKDTKKIMDVMIDLSLYSNREFLQIRTEETYTTIEEYIDEEFFMYDLEDYLAPINKQELLNDAYKFTVVYNSIIKKYFPALDDHMFKLYLSDESKVISIYPLLNIPSRYLQDRFSAEKKILDDVYHNVEKYDKQYSPDLMLEINNIEIFCSNIGSKLIIRNLIDIIQMNETYMAMDAYISNGQSRYRIIKYWLGLEQYILQQIIDADEDYYGKEFVVIYIYDGVETHNLYIYDDGSYKFVGLYSHTHNITFDNVMEITTPLVTPILDLVNANTQYLFAKLPKYINQNVEFSKINIKLKWNKQYTDQQFNKFVEVINEYYTAGILEKRNINPRPNTYSTKIVKGMTRPEVRLYLKKGIETKDYYIIFKDQKINDTWHNRYAGENLNIINTLVTIVFEIYNMTIPNFNRAYNYILKLINQIDEHITVDAKQKINARVGKKKKFKDIDPELYEFEDDKGTKYARICQKKHRPVDILTEEQYNNLSEKDRKYIFQFVNYTTNEPIYYKCSEKLPYAGFIVGKHPKGYCIPKCKESETNGIKNKQVWSLCMQKKMVNKDELVTKTHNDNILKFGKYVEEGKYSYMHESVISILDTEHDEFLLVGYEKNFDEINGGHILDILCYQLGVSGENLINKIASDLTVDIWNSLISVNIKYDEFMLLLGKFKENSSENQLNWTDTFIELAGLIFDVHIITLQTNIMQAAEMLNRNNSSISIKYTDLTKFSILSKSPITMCVIVHLYDQYYPVNLINYDGTIKLFSAETKINKKVCKIIQKIESNTISPYASFEYNNLKKLVKVKSKYIWQRRITYVETEDDAIIGCHDSINYSDEVQEIHSMVPTKNNSSFVNVAKALSELTREVPILLCFNKDLHKIENCTSCQFIGCRIDEIFCWFQPVTCDQVREVYPKFAIELINYDVFKVNKAIINNEKPLNKYLEGINQTYYSAYIYRIFKFEFYKLLLLYKKSQKTLVDKFKHNELQGYIQAKKSQFLFSYNKINQIIKYSEKPEEDLKNIVIYEDIFELRETLVKLSSTKLKSIMSDYITNVANIPDLPVENIIYSPIVFSNLAIKDDKFTYSIESNKSSETLFYKNGKLKVHDIDTMLNLLKKDLNNELLFKYEITNFQLMFVINYLNFHNYDDEKIIIKSL